MSVVKNLLGLFAGLSFGAIWILLGLTLSAVSLTVTLTIVYFFLAVAGVVPPQDFVPLVPYV
jgi:hypothetical protein